MDRFRVLILRAALLCSTFVCAPAMTAEIPLFTPALEEKLVHWQTPFVATYRKHNTILAFVAADHVFTAENNTVAAIASAFEAIAPAIVIVEGFPAAMGESPQALVEEARKRGTPEATSYANGEGMYAASLAIAQHIPFMGGEPTYEEEVGALMRKGFSLPDISYTFVLRNLGQSKRSGQIPSPDDGTFERVYEQVARGVARQLKTQSLSFEAFAARYREMFDADIRNDENLVKRNDPGTGNIVAAIGQADMRGRDEHLLATILKATGSRRRVLVVYGQSHWVTLSAALQDEFGKPVVR